MYDDCTYSANDEHTSEEDTPPPSGTQLWRLISGECEPEPEYEPALTATACFTEDAIVKTDQGLLPIKNITIENTINGKIISGVTKTIYPQDKLVVVEKNALGLNKPDKKTIVAPFHRFKINNKLVEIKTLVNGESIYYTKYNKKPLYNIILKTLDTMEVNNILVETLDPKCLIARVFDNSLSVEQRNKLVISIQSYHKRLKSKKNKSMLDYRVV